MTRGIVKKLVRMSEGKPLNKAFLTDVMRAIETKSKLNRRKPTRTYKPSSFTCLRQMYYQVIGEELDEYEEVYNSLGMADTGTRRHVAIQSVLQDMDKLGFGWKYLDVEGYIKDKQKNGKCLNIEIRGKVGAEVKLYDSEHNISFMCDGIVKDLISGENYLFEFKNQASFKYRYKENVDKEHVDQVSIYCACLDLDKALVLYENRDTCELECPEVFEVTSEMKEKQFNKISLCNEYIKGLTPPPIDKNNKACRWCKYKSACRRDGK